MQPGETPFMFLLQSVAYINSEYGPEVTFVLLFRNKKELKNHAGYSMNFGYAYTLVVGINIRWE